MISLSSTAVVVFGHTLEFMFTTPLVERVMGEVFLVPPEVRHGFRVASSVVGERSSGGSVAVCCILSPLMTFPTPILILKSPRSLDESNLWFHQCRIPGRRVSISVPK